MAPVNTIIFGATGGVGSAAAQFAKEGGANVSLAVRNVAKPLPNLTLKQEKDQGFIRVQADLTQPESLRKAVSATGATRAFVYLVLGSPDNMRASLEALKAAGIEFVVFLSSAGLKSNPRDARPDENFIFYAHMQVEINILEIFGKESYVSVRPAFFASNARWWIEMVKAGDLRVPYPQATHDFIVPKDIGRVAAAALVKGPSILPDLTEGHNVISLFGPRLISQEEQAAIMARVLGKEIKVTTVSEDEAVSIFARGGFPEDMARHLVAMSKARTGLTEDDGFYAEDRYAVASGNVERFGGRRPTEFAEWMEENKALFQ